MPSFLDKSEANFACAEHLYANEQYLCNSIAHYYYAVLQTMMHIVANYESDYFGTPKSGNEMFSDAKSNSKSTHEYIQNRCFMEHLALKFETGKLLETMDMFTNLKLLRVALEYREEDTTHQTSKAKKLATEIRARILKYAEE